jgi:heme exporter protein A
MKLLADNLTCVRGSRAVLSAISFAVNAGETLLLRGANGSGKTTLLRTLAGFITPASGQITLDGLAHMRELSEVCHYVGHLNGIKSGFTVGENLEFLCAFLGNDTAGADDKALAAFDLAQLRHVPAGLLSAGQKRRLGLARLLVAHRPVWLLDEPSVSLDAASQALLAAQVRAHVAGGGIVVAASHVSLGIDFTATLVLSGGRARLEVGGS